MKLAVFVLAVLAGVGMTVIVFKQGKPKPRALG